MKYERKINLILIVASLLLAVVFGIYIESRYDMVAKVMYGVSMSWKVKKVDLTAWIGSLGTIAAMFVAIEQTNKQSRITRALSVEGKRPRFDVETVAGLKPKTVILFNSKKSTECLKHLLNEKPFKFKCLGIRNISSNLIYSINVKVTYHLKGENKVRNSYFRYKGLLADQEVVLILDEFFNSKTESKVQYSQILLKFRSSGDEIGFYFNAHNRWENYYFVRNSNHQITVSDEDELIKVSSRKYKNLSRQFQESKNVFSKYIIEQ